MCAFLCILHLGRAAAQATDLLQFFEARYGPLHGFRFRDPLDNQAEEQLAIGDGAQDIFVLIKSYGAAPYVYQRRITKPVSEIFRPERACFLQTMMSPSFTRATPISRNIQRRPRGVI